MSSKNPGVDAYLADGCGRCKYYGTPNCKVHDWEPELKKLRALVLKSGIKEEIKWGMPCYTVESGNVLILSAFREYCSLNFFKGVLLKDPHKLLVSAGENSQSARQLRFTSLSEIKEQEDAIQNLIAQAIEVEKSGLKVELKAKNEIQIPDELERRFKNDPELEEAFCKLTPGRQRAYVIFFTGAKQSKTRDDRIAKYIPAILAGKGMND